MDLLMSLSGISKAFAGNKVLKGVSFDLRPGEVHALLGENGAGKSTLIKIIAGVHHPDEGSIRVGDKELTAMTPKIARDNGIAIVYQELLLFPELTVAENIFLGQPPLKPWGGIDWAETRRRSRELLDSLEGQAIDVDVKIASLSVANRQRVEIAKALAQQARVLVMDEPTASLTDSDVQQLMRLVRMLKSRGVGIVYVSHKLPEIFELADRVTVIRDGAHVATVPIGEVDERKLVNMMVGRSIDQLFPKVDAVVGKPLLELDNVSFNNVVRDISFTLRAGEILGVAGLVGSGRTEMALTIFGITPATGGTIKVDGKPVSITTPTQARDLGIAYVPEDRGLQGLVRPQTISQNVVHAVLDRITHNLIVNSAEEKVLADDAIARLGIRTRGAHQVARELSGGNQQKVVLGKWLATKPRILIMDEPTRGIDVGAKSEIHALMSKLAGEGLAILMISSELPEVLGMSDRVIVMREGRIVGEFDREAATPDAVGAAMTAASHSRSAA